MLHLKKALRISYSYKFVEISQNLLECEKKKIHFTFYPSISLAVSLILVQRKNCLTFCQLISQAKYFHKLPRPREVSVFVGQQED